MADGINNVVNTFDFQEISGLWANDPLVASYAVEQLSLKKVEKDSVELAGERKVSLEEIEGESKIVTPPSGIYHPTYTNEYSRDRPSEDPEMGTHLDFLKRVWEKKELAEKITGESKIVTPPSETYRAIFIGEYSRNRLSEVPEKIGTHLDLVA